MRKSMVRGFLGIMTMLNLSCNQLFYFPDDVLRATPDQLKLDFDSIAIKTHDQIELRGWWIRTDKKLTSKHESCSPNQPANYPIATIVQFHGNAQNMSSHFMFFAWMVPLGYDLVVFDYRGYGLSQGTPSREGLVLDGQAVLAWVKQHARTEDIIVIGQSLGGAVAVPAVAKSGLSRVKALVLDSTFSSYRKIARLKINDFWLTWPLQIPLSYLVSDNESAIDFIDQIKIPKLIIHGQNDPVVPLATGKALFAAAPPPKEFWLVPWEGHTAAFGEQNQYFRKKLHRYLCNILSANPRSQLHPQPK